jgi:transcriptional regulator with XRE-family HTH domain
MKKKGKRAPIEIIDGYIGKNLRYQRTKRFMCQEELGAMLGVTFQQVQKYEKAKNRMAASTLYKIASMFDIDINEFFDGLSNLPNKGLSGGEASHVPIDNILSRLAKVFKVNKKDTSYVVKKLREFIKAYDNKIKH